MEPQPDPAVYSAQILTQVTIQRGLPAIAMYHTGAAHSCKDYHIYLRLAEIQAVTATQHHPVPPALDPQTLPQQWDLRPGHLY
jgi:hypothetical protein